MDAHPSEGAETLRCLDVRRGLLMAVLAVCLFGFVGEASAQGTLDMRGTWLAVYHPNGSGNYPAYWRVREHDQAAGTFSGDGAASPDGNAVFTFTGILTGSSFTMAYQYVSSPYHGTYVGTISDDGLSWSGTAEDSSGGKGTFDGSRRRASATGVSCNFRTATSDFSCTAQVGDASGATVAIRPTGTVDFALDPGAEGSFPFGHTCTLAPSETGGPTGYCAVVFQPGAQGVPAGTQPPISALYSGDPDFAASSGRPESRYVPPPDSDPSPQPTVTPTPTPIPVQVPCASRFLAVGAQFAQEGGPCATEMVLGEIYEVVGSVFLQDPKTGKLTRVSKNHKLQPGQIIVMGADATVAMQLAEGGLVGMTGPTSFRVDVDRSRGGVPTLDRNLLPAPALETWGMWGKFRPRRPLTIQTRTGAMSIKDVPDRRPRPRRSLQLASASARAGVARVVRISGRNLYVIRGNRLVRLRRGARIALRELIALGPNTRAELRLTVPRGTKPTSARALFSGFLYTGAKPPKAAEFEKGFTVLAGYASLHPRLELTPAGVQFR